MMEPNRKDVQAKFDEGASNYDIQRRKLIPCFDDFYQVAVSLAHVPRVSPYILDLGAGTGLLSKFILEKYPEAKLTLIDLSEGMLELAKNRFKDNPNVEYILGDYFQYEPKEPFCIVISSLSIHHLEDPEKKDMYRRIFSMLKKGGIFVNADQVLGSSPFMQSLYTSTWKQKVESTDLSPQELASAYDRMKLDRMAPLQDQLQWLREIGFVDVDSVYQYYNFVVMHARKPL